MAVSRTLQLTGQLHACTYGLQTLCLFGPSPAYWTEMLLRSSALARTYTCSSPQVIMLDYAFLITGTAPLWSFATQYMPVLPMPRVNLVYGNRCVIIKAVHVLSPNRELQTGCAQHI